MTKLTTLAAAALLAGTSFAFAQASNDQSKSPATVKPMDAGAAAADSKMKASGTNMNKQPAQNAETNASGSTNAGGSKKNSDAK